jgi:hypothetical protein
MVTEAPRIAVVTTKTTKTVIKGDLTLFALSEDGGGETVVLVIDPDITLGWHGVS